MPTVGKVGVWHARGMTARWLDRPRQLVLAFGRYLDSDYSRPGLMVALLLGCASFTPSLLPRTWILQAAVAGFSAGFGYAVGVFLNWLVQAITGWQPSKRLADRVWLVFSAVSLPLIGRALWLGQQWQRDVRVLIGAKPLEGYGWIIIVLLAFFVFVATIGLARGMRWLVRRVSRRLRPIVPRRILRPVSVIVAIALVIGVSDNLMWRGIVEVANFGFGRVNEGNLPGATQPVSSTRSGSARSLVHWQTLGARGRLFVSKGPTSRAIAEFNGARALEPIRAYVGIDSAPTVEQRARLAVRELRRTRAFDREVLVVVGTTGTGTADPAAVDSIEYMYAGNTALVAVQYSYLPSWLSMLVDGEKAQETERALFDQVYEAWSEIPKSQRPKLLVTGTSLGAFGSEAAFSGLADVRLRTDGVLWAGPPAASTLHSRLVAQRDEGTPERLPVYGHGRAVRFAATAADLREPDGAWSSPRVLYLQNGSDPVVVWSPTLLFSRPDWLEEPPAPDVSPEMFWLPVVTFLQVTADLPFSLSVPPGHGHNYRDAFVDAWAAIAPPPGWSTEDSQRLRELMKHRALW